MDTEISQSEQWLRFLAWLEDNWQRVATIGVVVIGIGTVVAFFLWQGGQKQKQASQALSFLLVGSTQPAGAALVDFAREHEGTLAATRARLMAGGAFFVEGNYELAQAEFENLQSEPGAGPMIPEARFGLAACKDAQGQTEAAIDAYLAIVENPSNASVIPQARFALARLYMAQGLIEMARMQYQELASVPGLSLAAEARARLMEMPAPAAEESTGTPALTPSLLTLPTEGATNQP